MGVGMGFYKGLYVGVGMGACVFCGVYKEVYVVLAWIGMVVCMGVRTMYHEGV